MTTSTTDAQAAQAALGLEEQRSIDGLAVTRPSNASWAAEFWRAPAEAAAFWATYPTLSVGRRGDGHRVLVLPGLLANDNSTSALRIAMRTRGLRPAGWNLGPNIGPTERIVNGMAERLTDLYERSGRSVSIVGWSLGGLLGRELARRKPELVRTVITLGSPFRLRTQDTGLSNAGPIYDSFSRLHQPDWSRIPRESERPPLPCPSTSVFSRSDGIVPWAACVNEKGERHESVEVESSHCGLGFNPFSVAVVLDRLTQPEGEWQPYGGFGAARVAG